MNPTLAGFIAFVYATNGLGMGITTAQLPNTDPILAIVYNLAVTIVNTALQSIPNPDPTQWNYYAIAVYYLAADRLLNFAQDPVNAPIYKDNTPFFEYTRQKYNLTNFVPGVIVSTGDVSTSASFVVPEAFHMATVRDLQTLKTPWGTAYMGMVQDYGPTEWGLT